ncbi:MAG: fibronectin type III domain-containing protein [Paludibacteraceae bacterium]|nr:fibronectin type III domain-containing protein [Paludibacteraceae bacterium]
MKRLFFTFFAVMAMLFTAHAQTPAGYAIFGDVPYGYEDLTDQVEVSTSIAGCDNQMTATDYSQPTAISFTGRGLGNTYTCYQNVSVSVRFNSNQTLALTRNQAIHIKIKRTDENTSGGLEFAFIRTYWGGGGEGGRLGWEVPAANITATINDLVLTFGSTSSKGTWSTNGKGNFANESNDTPKDVTFTGATTPSDKYELFRINAANGEAFEISQIYIDADANTPDPVAPVAGDEDAPTDLTLSASNIQDKSVTLTASATDENSPISYQFFYKAEGDDDFTAVTGAVAVASGADAIKVVSGLTPSTTYSFKVVATDPSSNPANTTISNVTTASFIERRYYFFRGDPASVSLPSEGVVSYDLREGVGTTVGNGGGFSHSQKKYYTAFKNGGGWWSFNQNLSSAKDMSEISQAEWYLVVKFRTNISYGNFNIRLNNAISYQNGQNLSYESDGSWNVLTLALADAKNTLSYSASQSGTVFQFHSDGGAGYLDIAYAYLTNNAASVDDLADNVAPAISSVVDGDKTTSSVVLTVTASDDSGEDITYIVKEAETVLTSIPATGASGAATAITVSGLTGTDHTLTVIAQDGAGNEASQNKTITLPAAVTPPSNLVVTTTHTDKSVTFTMAADDSNASLVYAILDANNSDAVLAGNIAGTAGVNTVYTLKGLTPGTEYSFKVRVTNAASLSTTSEAIAVTTNALSEHRFYLTRGDNTGALPSGTNLTSTYVESNVEFGNSSRDNRASDYISAKTGNTWIAITLKPKATVENEIDDDWYIVVRFRSNLSHDVFGYNNFRLNLSNNAENWYINNSDDDKPFGRDYNDAQWIVVKKRIGDRRAGTAVTTPFLKANEVAAQLHVNNNLMPNEFLDIDYIYFTDDITSVDEGTQSLRRVVLKDNADNSAVLSAHNGETVDADLVRTLSSASYNSFCLPFNMSAAQVEETFGAGAKIGRLNNAAIEGDELLLGFGFVNSIEAGVPYLIQPEGAVANPFVENVTLANTEKPAVFNDVRFIGVLNPTEIQQESQAEHSVLLLGPNNELTWANTTANMRGMRAYFKTGSTVSKVVRRARLSFEGEQVATGLDEVQRDNVQCTKVIRDGQLYILHNGAMYNVQGVRVQ